MIEFITVARPYAKASFNFAIEQKKIEHWQSMLEFSSEVIRNIHISKLLSNVTRSEQLADQFITICRDKLDIYGQNLIRIMAKNGRLIILPDVLKQFIFLRSVQEKTVELEITSAIPLKNEQKIKIIAVMKQRLLRKVKLINKIDKSIIAGIIIRTENMVIDGSIRNRLKRLTDMLQS